MTRAATLTKYEVIEEFEESAEAVQPAERGPVRGSDIPLCNTYSILQILLASSLLNTWLPTWHHSSAIWHPL